MRHACETYLEVACYDYWATCQKLNVPMNDDLVALGTAKQLYAEIDRLLSDEIDRLMLEHSA
jgi:hypothetical protein